MTAGPPFGTASAYTDSFPSPPPKELTISAETCWNLSAFRDVIRQYRKLDDQIITRLNRAAAQLRDESRLAGPSHKPEGPDGMCFKMWREMMAGWAHRQTLLTYCLGTVNASIEAKRPQSISRVDERLEAVPSRTDGTARQRGVKEEEVYANQLTNEDSIEAIIRKRSLEAFKTRCPYFYSTMSPRTVERQWWDLADSGRKGKGPDV